MKNVGHETTLPRWSCSRVVMQPRGWQVSNGALASLLANHRRILGRAVRTAATIRRGMDELAPLMAALCRRTCRFCPEPCCINNTVWFDFRDLLLFHLLEAPIPSRQAASDADHACPFLDHHGCRLPSQIRPWMCIQYICPAQLSVLKKDGQASLAGLLAKIDRIGKQRLRMEAQVVRRLRRMRRTSSSSSLASSR